MKHLYFIIAATLALCISCKGRSSVEASDDSPHDSIIAAVDGTQFSFLTSLGIDVKPLVMADTFPQAPHNPSSVQLTIAQQRELLSDAIYMGPDSTLEIIASLVAVSAVNESITMCLYYIKSLDEPERYIATYDSTGKMIDALFIGYGDEVERKLSDSTVLKAADNVITMFIAPQEFTHSRHYEEIEHNVITNRDSVTYSKSSSMTYNIDMSGKIEVTMEDNYEEGRFRFWHDSEGKTEWNLYNEIQALLFYPYSDKNILKRWNELGNKVDGATAEAFKYYFFKYVFLPQSEKVLKWIYANRDSKSLSLTTPLEAYYNESPESKEVIDKAIADLDNPAIRAYCEDMTELWHATAQPAKDI